MLIKNKLTNGYSEGKGRKSNSQLARIRHSTTVNTCSLHTEARTSGKRGRNLTRLNHSHLDSGQREKINLNLCFHTFCGALKSSMKVLMAFIKPFETSKKKSANKNLS